MISKTALKALAVALPLSLGAIAPAAAQDYYGDRYSRDYYGRDYYDRDYYRNYDRDYYYGDRYDHRTRILSSRQIAYRLSRDGYSRIRNVSYSRAQRHYHAVALDWRGRWVRLSVSPYSGRVTDRDYLYASYRDRYRRRYYDYGY